MASLTLAVPSDVHEPVRKPVGGWNVLLLVLWWVVLIKQAFIFLAIVPNFSKLFAEFNVKVPWLARSAIAFSDWLVGRNPGQLIAGWLLVLPAYVGLCVIPFVALRSRRDATRTLARVVLVSLLIMSGTFFTALVSAFYEPLVNVINALQQGKP